MMEALIVAGFSGMVLGSMLLGSLRSETKALKSEMRTMACSLKTLHARFDALVLALAKRGAIDIGAVAHLARMNPR